MAKATPTKATAAATKAPAKAATKKAAPKTTTSPTDSIVKVCMASLAKLNQLGIEPDLQSDLNWCLGSFQNDGNPIGLFQMAERSLIVFKTEQAKKTKGVTATLITDLEKALKAI